MKINENSMKTNENQWTSMDTSGGSRRHGRSLKIKSSKRCVTMLPYMYLLPLSDDEVERLDAADASYVKVCVVYLEKLTFINI